MCGGDEKYQRGLTLSGRLCARKAKEKFQSTCTVGAVSSYTGLTLLRRTEHFFALSLYGLAADVTFETEGI